MGFYTTEEMEIIDMAWDMGDRWGADADTITTIARVLAMDPLEVQRVLHSESDEDPMEYAERAADQDAVYYGA